MQPHSGLVTVGSLLAGKYRIERELGRGGMGQVLAAENIDIGRKVAIKVLHRGLAEDAGIVLRFRQEARAAAAIGHPGIVEVLDMGSTDDGCEFIVMEHLTGETLAARMERVGKMKPEEIVPIVVPLLEALAAAHDKGIVHRDLKPENVFLPHRPPGAVKILDFGISKFRSGDDVALTRTGVVMGSPLYMAPEQARGARDVGPAADLYAVGVILYQGLCGDPPFTGTSYNEVMAAVLTDTARPIGERVPGLDRSLAALVDKLLVKNPVERMAAAGGADALRAALLRAVDTSLTRPDTRAPDEVLRLRAQRRLVLVAVGGAVAVASLVGGLLLRRPGRPTPPPVTASRPAPPPSAPAPAPTPGDEIGLSLAATPLEARFTLDGLALDGNPVTVRRRRGVHATLSASAPGFMPQTLDLTFDVPRLVPVALAPLPAGAPVVPSGTRRAPREPAPPGAAEKPAPATKKGLQIDRHDPFQ